jgi:hypothetical protein
MGRVKKIDIKNYQGKKNLSSLSGNLNNIKKYKDKNNIPETIQLIKQFNVNL